MTGNKQIYLLILLILITGAIAVSAPAEPPQDIYVLIAADNDNPVMGERHEIDQQKIVTLMESSLLSMLEKEELGTTINIDELRSSDEGLTAANILDWLRRVNPGPDDVVFVYFSGSGAADEDGEKERFLLVTGDKTDDKLYRKELVKIMDGLNCRLKILITEVGSLGPPATQPRRSTNTRRLIGVSTHAPLTQTDVLRQLFFEHEGFLNLTATSLGHYALGSTIDGGWFTKALIDGMLPADLSKVDRNPQNGFVSWEEVFQLTKEYLNELYKANESKFSEELKEMLEECNQTTQTPEVLSHFPKSVQ